MRNLLSILCFLLPFWVMAQTNNPKCFILKSDATGFERNYEADLNTIAFEIATLLEQPNDFKVFDYGLYLHLTSITGAVEDVMTKIDSVSAKDSKFYLTITKIPSYDKVIERFDVKLKLPNDGKFDCLNNSKVELIRQRVSSKINTYHQSKFDTDFKRAIELGLIELKNSLASIKSGNCCPLDFEVFKKQLYEKGYTSIPAKFINKPFAKPTAKDSSGNRSAGNLVEDFAKLLVKIEGSNQFENFEKVLEKEVLTSSAEGINSIGFLTKDENICEPIGIDIQNGFSSFQKDAYLHCHFSPNPDTSKWGWLFFFFQPKVNTVELPEVTITDYRDCAALPLPTVPVNNYNYAITKDNGEFYGYRYQFGNWGKFDKVEAKTPVGADNDKEKTWGDKGAYRHVNTYGAYVYEPSFIAWWWSEPQLEGLTKEGGVAKILNPTQVLDNDFHKYFQKGFYQSEKDKIYQQFKYPSIYAPNQDYSKGTTLEWKCDTKMGKAMKEIKLVKDEIDKVEILLTDWLKTHDDLNGLFIAPNPATLPLPLLQTKSPNLYEIHLLPPSLPKPFWAAQIWGGTQGRNIQVKSLKRLDYPCANNLKRYECEFIFTVRDNFGVGISDGKKWYIPGVIEQWVLQHYRNNDCSNPPCFVPITSHTVEIYHKFQLCK